MLDYATIIYVAYAMSGPQSRIYMFNGGYALSKVLRLYAGV